MKTAPPMNTFEFLTLRELHQLWQAVILKPIKLKECTLHFWKPPIFINLDVTDHSHSCILNTRKSFVNDPGFISWNCGGVYFKVPECTMLRMSVFSEPPCKRSKSFKTYKSSKSMKSLRNMLKRKLQKPMNWPKSQQQQHQFKALEALTKATCA